VIFWYIGPTNINYKIGKGGDYYVSALCKILVIDNSCIWHTVWYGISVDKLLVGISHRIGCIYSKFIHGGG